MNYLKINQLRLQNIRCYSDQKFEFSHGKNTLLGNNGSGKSTVLESIGMGLFGSKYLKKPKTVSDLVNRSQETGRITLDFEVPKGRFRSEFSIGKKNSFKLYELRENGRPKILTNNTKETIARITSLIGRNIDAETFKNALSSPQGELTDLIEETPANRKKAIQKILGLEKYQVLELHMKNFTKGIDKELGLMRENLKVREESIEDPGKIEEELKTRSTELEEKKKRVIGVSTKLDSTVKAIGEENRRRTEYNSLKSKLKAEKENLLSTEKRISRIEPESGSLAKELGIAAEIQEVEDLRTRVNTDLDCSKEELVNVANQRTERINLQDDKNKREQRVETIKEEKQKMQGEFDRIVGKKTIQILKDEVESIDSELSTRRLSLKSVESEIKNLQGKVKDHDKRVSELERSVETTERRFRSLFKDDIGMYSEVLKNFENKISEVSATIENLEKRKTDVVVNKAESETKMKELKKVIDLLESSEHTENCPTCMQKLGGIDLSSVLEIHRNTSMDLQKTIEKLSSEASELEEKLKESKGEKKNVEKSLKEISRFDPTNHKEQVDTLLSLRKEKDDLSKKILELEEMVKSLQKEIEEKSQSLNGLKTKLKNAEGKEREIQKLTTEIKLNLEEIEKLNKKLQAINEEELKKRSKVLKTKRSDLEARRSKVDRFHTVLTELSKYKYDKAQQSKRIAEYNEKIEKIELMSDDDFQKLDREKSELTSAQGALQAQIKTLTEEIIPSIEERLKTSKEQLVTIKGLKDKIHRYKKAHRIYKVLEGIFNKLPHRLLYNISESVSNVMTDRMQTMFPNRNISRAILNTEGEIVLHQDGHRVDPKQLSGGERTALGLALRIALMRHVAPLEFMILDEPTNHLDTDRINEFLSIIQDNSIFQSPTGQLLLVTHREEFEKIADRIIKIEISQNGERKVSIS